MARDELEIRVAERQRFRNQRGQLGVDGD
jgi:hypothetical protein